MFKYNELSDLTDGTLVIPLYKTEDGQICVKNPSNGTVFYVDFDDFDFDILPEERGQTAPTDPDPQEPDPQEPQVPDPQEPTEPIEEEKERDDADYDGTDNPEETIIVEPTEPAEEEKERWLTKDEALTLAKEYGVYTKGARIRGYKYII